MAVGYRWFQQKNIKPLFPFGFGLSYTHFTYTKLNATPHTVSFDLHNAGSVAGDEIAEVYVTLPTSAGEPFRKLAAWKRVTLAAGATQRVEIPIDPLYLSTFSTETNSWTLPLGDFQIEVGGSSNDLPLHQSLHLAANF
jgi:beta-glucosidase